MATVLESVYFVQHLMAVENEVNIKPGWCSTTTLQPTDLSRTLLASEILSGLQR